MDIEAWLRSLGLERYEAAFRENEIDWAVLPELTADDLKDIGRLARLPNIVALRHNRADLTQGSSGGAWVANFDKREDGEYNTVIAVTSYISKSQSGVSFGPYPTSAFYRLLDYVSKGCSR